MFENPRRGRQARNFTTNVPKILVLKSSSEQIFSPKLPLGAPGFSQLIPAAGNFKNNAQETYVYVSEPIWFCHLHVISLLSLSSIAIEGEYLAKLGKINWTTVT